MKAELQEQLFNRFPWTRPNDRESLMSQFGFAVGDGWYDLIEKLLSEIEGFYRAKGLEVKLELAQVKEKFGELRVYFHDGLDELFDLAIKYEELSKGVCYDCGKIGTHRRIGAWWITMCDPCVESRIADAKQRLDVRE